MNVIDWSIIGLLSAIAIFDVAVIIAKVGSISGKMREYGSRVTAFPYMWGVLGGHFWGPNLDPVFGNWTASIALLVGIGLVLSVIHFTMRRLMTLPDWTPLIYFPVGIPAGMFLWPQ